MRSTPFLALTLSALAATPLALAQGDAKPSAKPIQDFSGKGANEQVLTKQAGVQRAVAAPQVEVARPMPSAAPAAPVSTAAPVAAASAADVEKARAVLQRMLALEQQHRELQATIDRLLTVYGELNQSDKIGELKDLRTKENTRYAAAMDGFKAELGPELHAKIVAALNAAPGGADGGATHNGPGPGGKPRRGGRQGRGG